MKNFSLRYFLLQKWVEPGLRFYFKNLVIDFEGHLYNNDPVIYVANHQNAFIDAILIAVASNKQPASLVRADVFKNSAARTLLSSIKMMPVYRMRDGYRTPAKNEKTFQNARDYLAQNGSLIIFPEGNHGGLKKLRTLKHGAARVAVKTILNSRAQKLVIQPVGLEYSDHSKFRSNAAVIFGRPIMLQKNELQHRDDERQILRYLTTQIEKGLKSIIYHQNAERENRLIYDFINTLYPESVLDKDLFRTNFQKGKSAAQQFNLNPLSAGQIEAMQSVLKKAKNAEFPGADYEAERDYKKPKQMKWSFLIPALPAVTAYFIPYLFLKFLQYKIADVQFRTSIKFTLGIVIFPFWNVLLFFLFGFLTHFWILAAIAIILLNISGRCFLYYHDAEKEVRRTGTCFHRRNSDEYREILNTMEDLIPGKP